MTSPPDDTTADTSAIIAALRAERDAALSEKAALAEALATRNSEFGERIEYQAATLDVLKAMSASPGDPQPVFDLIVERARDLCEGYGATVLEFDGRLLLHRASTGIDDDPAIRDAIIAAYPKAPVRSWPIDLAVLERRLIIVDDLEAEPNLDPALRNLTHKSVVSMPLMRGEVTLGALALGGRERGGFSDSQIELLKTFAEQAVIAISSAETFRALQTRTSDLQETLEYQNAISNVLKVISRSTFDLQPVLDTVVETAARLCDADMAAIGRPVGNLWRLAANFGFPSEFEAHQRASHPLGPDSPAVAARAVREKVPVHIHDAAAVPGYPNASIRLGKQRTSLGVPLLREGEAIGYLVLARQRVEPFTDRQIELVSTFADQAVIAIENTRLLTEQREALEQRTATAEVLQVINASPGNLTPVFKAILEKAHDLCDIAYGDLQLYDGEHLHSVAQRGLSARFADRLRQGYRASDSPASRPLLAGDRFTHITDAAAVDFMVFRSAVQLDGIRTVLFVPLRKDGSLLGMITSARREVRPFTEKEIALLENFAAQAVIAMENARLINDQREALEQQTATAEVLQVINASPGNLAPVFEAILEKAHRICNFDMGSLATYDGTFFRAVAARGYGDQAEVMARTPYRPLTAQRALLRGDRLIHIPDTQAYPVDPNDAAMPAFFMASGFRACLMVPLRKDGTLLGFLTGYRKVAGPFSEKQIVLLENFAAQAVIAMENARLITEQREALEQQTATAEVLQVINASPGNLAPVFDAMLEKAMRLCGGTIGGIFTFDGDHSVTSAMRGVTAAFQEYNDKYPLDKIQPGTVPARVIETRGPVQNPDVTVGETYRAGHPYARALVELGGIRAVLAVPLLKDGVAVGMVAIYRQEAGAFSDKQIALLQNFAAQAVIAMENARLLTEQREALEQQTATAEVLQVINASPGNLAPVFDAMLEKAHSLCGATKGAFVTFNGELFQVAATRGLSDTYARFLKNAYPEVKAGYAADELSLSPREQLLNGVDLVHLTGPAVAIGPIGRAVAELENIRTLLFVPLRRDGALLGYITAYREEEVPFSDKQIALLQNFAAQAVIAMENARLLNEIRQRQEELRITFENMGDGVALFDETRHLVASNRRFQDMLDVPDRVISARPAFADYIRYLADRGEYGPGAEAHVQRLLEFGSQSAAFERTRPNGRIIEIRVNPVPNGGFVVIYSDITERKRSEEEIRAARDAAEEASRTIEAAYRDLKAAQANLIQAEKMASLGQLTAGIAHEIKNPLNFVNNFAALSVDLLSELKETAAPGFAVLTEKQRAEVEEVSVMLTSNLEKITEHGKRADGIVKAMLEHSRGSSGERRMVDLNALIDEALNLAYHGARAQDQSFNITLERDFGEGIAAIEVNPQDITRVFLNIFSNGVYAATRRARNGGDAGFVPTLKVTTIDAGEAVEIRVRDNGTGIPADIRDKLFQPFFTTKPTGEGTGLGLSITYDIVTQQHGGSIAVDSEVGEYSEFTIRLPRNQ